MHERLFEYAFTHVTSVHISGSLHGFQATEMSIEIVGPTRYGIHDPGLLVDAVTNDITITFMRPQTGVIRITSF